MPNSKSRSAMKLAMGVNLAFWVVLGAEFLLRSKPYEPHAPKFEEQLPIYQFGGRALPTSEEPRCWSLWFARIAQSPALFAGAAGFNAVLGTEGWDFRMGVLSLGSWILSVTMLLSFLQWFVILYGATSLYHWLTSRTGAGSPRHV